MCGATTDAMPQQLQLPRSLHYSCHVTANAVAMLCQLHLPCDCRIEKMQNGNKKMQMTWCGKSSCHV